MPSEAKNVPLSACFFTIPLGACSNGNKIKLIDSLAASHANLNDG